MPAKTLKAVFGGDEGKTPAVEIPFDVKATYGSARPKVSVTVNGVVLRTTVAVYGRSIARVLDMLMRPKNP
jgi:Domain of unknown function (DUF1905)